MDFIFNCSRCQGPLVTRSSLRGLHVFCAHCTAGIEVPPGKPATEAVISALLDAPQSSLPGGKLVLRRARAAARHSSAGASAPKTRLPRGARIS